MALLTLRNVGKRIGGSWAIWDLDLELGSGEIVGVFGRSGSGKSILARLLARLEEPTNGTIILGDQERAGAPRVSVAFASPAYAPELTTFEILDLFGALWGVPARRRGRDIAFLLQLLGLAEQRNERAAQLASGALRRLEIARVLLADAPVAVIDSLLDGMEPDVFERLWEHILAIRRGGLRSFVVLTASSRVAGVCQKIAVLHKGRIAFVGRPDDFRGLAGEDVIVLGDLSSPLLKNRIQEQFSVVIREEDGFLSFRVANGDRIAGDLLAEFGKELSCVYLKRPTLDDALTALETGGSVVTAGIEGNATGKADNLQP